VNRLRQLSPAILLAAALLAGCGGGGSTPSTTTTSAAAPTTSTGSSTAAATAVVSTRSLSGLGTVLVNGQGRTLYVFMPDKHVKVTCLGACAQLWPPTKLAAGQKASAAGEVKATLLATDPDPEGGRVATYAGWPLYTYVPDTAPGQATGQDLETSGGKWYVIAPSGKLVTKAP
jgi:predicted lipoprotein with Yx(FWY)xxD motif